MRALPWGQWRRARLQSIRRRGAAFRVDGEEAVIVGHLYPKAALVAMHGALKVNVVVTHGVGAGEARETTLGGAGRE